jgi:mannitol/fructose-specific phosphotransferase system IIA component (Ntr-type)
MSRLTADGKRLLMSSHLHAARPAVSMADFTSVDLIVPQLQGRDAPTVIRELCEVLHRADRVPALLPFYHAALNREFLLSTTMDYGLAFPHARSVGLSQLSLAVGRSLEPLLWVPKDRPPLRLVFLCAVPATDATGYLLVASGLARLAKEPQCLKTLLEADGSAGILDTLGWIKLRPAKVEGF